MGLSNLKIGLRIYVAFGIIVALLAASVIVAEDNFNRLDTANSWNVHSYEVLGEANALQLSLINMETGQRGFSLTGPRLLAPTLN